MRSQSKLKSEDEVYTPKKKIPRGQIFKELCNDPDFPCRECQKCKSPLTCLRMNDCPEYYIWFSREWKRIRKALKIEKTKKIH